MYRAFNYTKVSIMAVFLALLVAGLVSFSLEGSVIKVPKKHPFAYDLGVRLISGKVPSDSVTICCHGYGHNNQVADIVSSFDTIPGDLVGFNFPDYNITGDTDHRNSKFGSIDEILPLLFLIRYYACDLKLPAVNLYGFSAGAGAIVNALAVINKRSDLLRLSEIGITAQQFVCMSNALEKGQVILDCPLKSVDEIIAFRGTSPGLEAMRANYALNNMNPIDVLPQLAGFNLNIMLNFQKFDDVLSNRDDAIFIERLRKANSGHTAVVIGSDGGHNSYHANLWSAYKHLNK